MNKESQVFWEGKFSRGLKFKVSEIFQNRPGRINQGSMAKKKWNWHQKFTIREVADPKSLPTL